MSPQAGHWNGVKDIFCYLKGTTNLGLFYTRESPSVAAPYGPRVIFCLVGYADPDICLTHIEHVLK